VATLGLSNGNHQVSVSAARAAACFGTGEHGILAAYAHLLSFAQCCLTPRSSRPATAGSTNEAVQCSSRVSAFGVNQTATSEARLQAVVEWQSVSEACKAPQHQISQDLATPKSLTGCLLRSAKCWAAALRGSRCLAASRHRQSVFRPAACGLSVAALGLSIANHQVSVSAT
jgi:hypothetical protein